MLYKMDNTTFGGNIPSLPQWTGAPRAIIQVQAMLYASLAASIFSAFLAMLGKQWLNRYASTDMRGTAVERSQDRQRKLDGIIAWYFDHVMESLPLMLQLALLLLGCALSLYLWDIEVTVACVVLGVTALGVISYAFFIVAGAAFPNCPYQTPYAHILRHILPPIISQLYSVCGDSACLLPFSGKIPTFFCFIPLLPLLLAYDAYQLTRAIVRTLFSLSHKARSWFLSARTARTRGLNLRTATLDLRCISWILHTSLEKDIHLSALKFLAIMPTLVDFNPTLVLDCFNILISCIKVNGRNPMIVQGMEQLSEASAMCFFRTYSYLSTVDPMSSILIGIR